jgi:imidazolonepropionase-like amidohydrolase
MTTRTVWNFTMASASAGVILAAHAASMLAALNAASVGAKSVRSLVLARFRPARAMRALRVWNCCCCFTVALGRRTSNRYSLKCSKMLPGGVRARFWRAARGVVSWGA